MWGFCLNSVIWSFCRRGDCRRRFCRWGFCRRGFCHAGFLSCGVFVMDSGTHQRRIIYVIGLGDLRYQKFWKGNIDYHNIDCLMQWNQIFCFHSDEKTDIYQGQLSRRL